MIRPLLSLERLSLDEREGQVGYRYGKEAKDLERMDHLEFIARVTSHISDVGHPRLPREAEAGGRSGQHLRRGRGRGLSP